MPRYFFHLENDNHVEDAGGEVLATLEEAKAHARLVAAELGAHQTEQHNKDLWVCVTDEGGKEVFRVSLDGKIGGGD
jgi:uncharacterized protein DUF6894